MRNTMALPALAASGLALALALLAASALTGQGAASRNCFQELERGRAAMLSCDLPTRLSEDERTDLKSLTGDRLQDAHCVVAVRIERRLVEAALIEPEHVFEAPPQAVRCEVITTSEVWPITATFATRVVFQGGIAVDASPGLANVEGVSAYLASPVVQYVNRAPGIRDAMLHMINTYRAHHQQRLSRVGRR
jgi:hypothetical protein